MDFEIFCNRYSDCEVCPLELNKYRGNCCEERFAEWKQGLRTTIINGDALEELKKLPAECVHTCVTSPPYYGQRDYGVDGQIGCEETLEEYIERLVNVFREVRRVLSHKGTLWLNIGDTYATGTKAARQQSTNPGVGSNRPEAQNGTRRIGNPTECKTKDLVGVPWALAFALRADGWYLRQDIIWDKPNAQPESVKDRCTKSHEYIFLLAKSQQYYFNAESISEPSATGNKIRNKRNVWHISTQPYRGAHFATFPEKLIEPCILAGCPEGGTVLDPFAGSGTTGVVSKRLGRDFVGYEINPNYVQMAIGRIAGAPQGVR